MYTISTNSLILRDINMNYLKKINYNKLNLLC